MARSKLGLKHFIFIKKAQDGEHYEVEFRWTDGVSMHLIISPEAYAHLKNQMAILDDMGEK